MIKKQLFFNLIIAIAGILAGSCTQSTAPQELSPQPSMIEDSPTDLSYFLQQYQTVEAGTNIPQKLCQQYIQPALVKEPLHPYLPLEQATYSYGQILYEDSNIVALTFYYKATQHKNLLAASFLATFDRQNGQFIDNKMVFGSSTFDYQQKKGYDMGLSYKSDIEFLDSDALVLVLKSKVKQLYSHFKKGVPQKPNVIQTRRYSLLKNGQFVFK